MSSTRFAGVRAFALGAAILAITAPGPSWAEQVSASGGHTVDVGLAAPISVPAGRPLKVAFFIATMSNLYTQAMADEARRWATDNGVELEIFDAQFNSQQQLDQLENVLQNGDFNAWYVTPIDGNLTCNVMTRDAPANNIIVITSNIATCGRDADPAEKQWVPGLLAYVGAEETVDYVDAWADAVAVDRGDQPTKALIMYGAPGLTISNNIEAAYKRIAASHPNFEVVGSAYTNFTTADAQAKAETLIQAHPDANVVLSAYSDITNGMINALDDKDRVGQVAVYDIGAGSSTLPLIKSGAIRASAVFSPRTHATTSLDALREAWVNGTIPPRYMTGLHYGDTDKPYLVTKDNVDEFKAEY
jgi:ABC-type sugar transport system substrate-binding protein